MTRAEFVRKLLGVLYQTQGRFREAEPLYKRAPSVREMALAPDHQDVAQSWTILRRCPLRATVCRPQVVTSGRA
jgi:hypothetical protein